MLCHQLVLTLLALLVPSIMTISGLPLQHQPPPVDRSPMFDPLFLQKAMQGQLPGVDTQFVLDLAWWFHSKSVPCCERILRESHAPPSFNCTSFPEPTDQRSSRFLFRMITECIGEARDVSECCTLRGVKSPECLALCNMGHPGLGAEAFETDAGSELMQRCADRQRVPRDQFLWMMFECVNPNFARVTRLTQQLRAQEEARKAKEAETEGTTQEPL